MTKSRCFLIFIVTFILSGCTTAPLESEEQEEVIPVQTESVRQEPFSEIVELSGRTRSKQEFPIMTPDPTMVEAVYVELGDEVRAGDPLLLLDHHLGTEGGQIGREVLQRARALVDGAQTGAVTMLELETSRQLLNQSQTETNENSEQQIIHAPFDGVITLLNIQPGGMAGANTPLMQLSKLDQLIVDLQVGSSQIYRLQAGMRAHVWFDHLSRPIEASLDALSPGTSAEGNFYQAQIYLANEENHIFPGMPARVEVEIQYYEDALLIPVESVFFQDEEAFAYTIIDEQAHLTEIELEGRNPTHYRVISGLEEGDQVVTLGRERLTDGRKVYISHQN